MRRALCTAGALFAVAGCAAGPGDPVAGSAPVIPPASGPAAVPLPPAPLLPPPAALADVVYRLADPRVPAAEKLTLVARSGPSDIPTLDGFAAALRDGGYTPVTVTAADVAWSSAVPGDVSALITITGPEAGPGPFRFPMGFRAHDGGWQLTRETADLLFTAAP